MTWTPPDDPRDPPVYHTPLPLHVDERIERLARELAECRTDLDAEARHLLARQLDFRARTYRTPGNTR